MQILSCQSHLPSKGLRHRASGERTLDHFTRFLSGVYLKLFQKKEQKNISKYLQWNWNIVHKVGNGIKSSTDTLSLG